MLFDDLRGKRRLVALEAALSFATMALTDAQINVLAEGLARLSAAEIAEALRGQTVPQQQRVGILLQVLHAGAPVEVQATMRGVVAMALAAGKRGTADMMAIGAAITGAGPDALKEAASFLAAASARLSAQSLFVAAGVLPSSLGDMTRGSAGTPGLRDLTEDAGPRAGQGGDVLPPLEEPGA